MVKGKIRESEVPGVLEKSWPKTIPVFLLIVSQGVCGEFGLRPQLATAESNGERRAGGIGALRPSGFGWDHPPLSPPISCRTRCKPGQVLGK